MLLGPRVERLTAAAAHGDGMQAVAAAERRLEVLADEVLSLEQRLESGRLPASSLLARLSSTRRRLYSLYDDSFRTATLKGALAADDSSALRRDRSAARAAPSRQRARFKESWERRSTSSAYRAARALGPRRRR